MAGYIRQDTTGAISTNSIIEADDLNNEFDAVEGAFNATTGHSHDGTSAEGAPIEVLGPTQDVVITASALRPKTDNTVDLGTASLEFKDLYIDGTANIDNLVADAGTVGGVDITTTSNTQTLTNKTLTAPTMTGAILNDGYTEEVFAVTGTTPALSPTNGSIQTWTLSGNSTPTAGTWGAGQSITLMVDDGTAYTITWTTLAVVWKTNGGSAPTLNTSGDTAIELWKVGTTIYGARVGDA